MDPVYSSDSAGKNNSCKILDRPRGFLEFETPRFQDIQHMKVVNYQPNARRSLPTMKYSWYSFLIEADSTPGL